MKELSFKISLLVFFFWGLHQVNAQQTFKVDAEESKVLIEGTSNIHDWEMTAENPNSTLKLNQDALEDIASIYFEVMVQNMKSGKSKMDKNTYKALNEEDHEKIYFKSSQIEYKDGTYHANGKLNIAGTEKQVKIPFQLKEENNKLHLNLTYPIHMLDYKVEPPTALFGTIKTGEDVTINMNLIYK
jgi:polyisoprenoid-binding protein YceI